MTAKNLPTFTRFDSFKVPKVKRTKEGYLRGDAIVSRAGVFDYRNADGTIRKELRHPDDVFKLDSLETLKMLPITVDHPPEFVDAANAHKYDKGSTGESFRIDGDYIITTLTVRHQDAINAIEDGNHEISLGYSVELIPEKGVYKGVEYDFRQINHDYNHLALVERGRAGSMARLRYDCAAELIQENEITDIADTERTNNLNQEETITMKEEVKNMDETIQLRVDSLNAENKQVKTENELLKERLDKACAKLECLEKSYKQLSQELTSEKAKKTDSIIDSKVDDKVDLLVRAAPYLDDLNAYLRHSPREIMIKVINAKHNDEQDFADKDDSYIKGKFDSITGTESKTRRDHAEIFSVLKKHNDHAINGTRSDHMFTLMQEIKQKRMMSN